MIRSEDVGVGGAFLGIVYAAHRTERGELPERLRPVDSGTAAEILARAASAEEASPMDRFRRQAAITVLVGGSNLRRISDLLSTDTSVSPFARELATLHAPLHDIVTGLEQAPDCLATRLDIERATFRILWKVEGPPCQANDIDWVSWTVEKAPSHLVTATAVFRVARAVEDVSVSLDPQEWDQCSSAFFKETYVANLQAGVPTKEPSPPQLATDWEDMLYEHFEAQSPFGKTLYKNLLTITLDANYDAAKDPNYRPNDPRGRYCELTAAIRSCRTSEVGGRGWKPSRTSG
jgi:hypothetical protein